MQSYVNSGSFTIRIHATYFFILEMLGVTARLYFTATKTFADWQSLLAFAMSVSNAWGFLLVLLFMGSGLVIVPRYLWQEADEEKKLRRLEQRAPAAMEELEDAEMDRREMSEKIERLISRVPRGSDAGKWVERLKDDFVVRLENEQHGGRINRHPLNVDEDEEEDIPARVTETYLEHIHWKAKRVWGRQKRCQVVWDELFMEAWHLEDVLRNTRHPDPIVTIPRCGLFFSAFKPVLVQGHLNYQNESQITS